jgi:O-acetyl-ADP-ribose deacetylase (regulator of RNase III)
LYIFSIVAVVIHGTIFVYNLITKPLYHNKPTYDDLERSLVAMKKHAIDNKVKRIAMPRIGCGLDGLQWRQVMGFVFVVFFFEIVAPKI